MDGRYSVMEIRKTATDLPAQWQKLIRDTSSKVMMFVDFNIMEVSEMPDLMSAILGVTSSSNLHAHIPMTVVLPEECSFRLSPSSGALMVGSDILKVIILPLGQGLFIHPMEMQLLNMVTDAHLHCSRVLAILSKMPDWHATADTPVPLQVLLVYDPNSSWCKDTRVKCCWLRILPCLLNT